jgi:hypothetical protein
LLHALHGRYADTDGIATLVYETEVYRAPKLPSGFQDIAANRQVPRVPR